jgi:RNA polymerase sigma-70 factor (ECF subfamily)
LKPYFYQTYWFYAVCLVALLLLAWLVFRLRVRGMQAQFGAGLAERTRIARDVHDNLAQEIAAQLWKAFPAWDEARPFATWMYRVALNTAISHARGNAWRERHVALEDSPIEPAHDAEAERETGDGIRALYRVIDRLAALDRALLLLYLDERSQREIAEILGIGESNVATKIGRLKLRIRNEFGD